MASVWAEPRRRNVVRAGIACLAGVWALIQVADVVVPNLTAPDGIIQALIISSALGLPVALLLAWFYEITPEGIKTAGDASGVEVVKFTGRKIDFAIIGLLVLAVGFIIPARETENGKTRLATSTHVG